MLRRIKARNFLSLRDIDLELGPRNVLVGPNMSGKSNLIECLKFLQESVGRAPDDTTSLQQAFAKRGSFEEVVWKGNREGPIALEIVAELIDPSSQQSKSCDYEVAFRRGEYHIPEVDRERLTLGTADASQPILESAEGKSKAVIGGASDSVQNPSGRGPEGQARWPTFEGRKFWNFVANWRFYHLMPALMRQSNPPGWEDYLSEHGENLSSWLLTLQNRPQDFKRIKKACREVLPGLAEILFQPVAARRTSGVAGPGAQTIALEPAKISVGVAETPFKMPISIVRMSDGELALLALMSLILAPEELTPSLLCIEEPENHLHPKLLEVLIEVLNQRQAEDGNLQVIATTHSPLLVDKLGVEDLIVTQKQQGETRFIRASSRKKLKKLLSRKETSLRDLK